MNAILIEANKIAATGLAAFLNTLWYAAAGVGLTWVALRLRPGVNAATRYWIWTVVLAFLFVLPFLPAAFSQARTALTARADTSGSKAVPLATVPALPEQSGRLAPVTLPISDKPGSHPWPLWLAAVWILAAGWQLARLAAGLISVRRLKARAHIGTKLAAALAELPVHESNSGSTAKRRLQVLISNEIGSPVAVGYMHPAIVVPPGLISRLTEYELRNVLLHELAHLARYDDWLNLTTRSVGALLALHPLAPFVLRRIEREREMACDDFVVQQSGSAGGYARSLVRLHDLRWKTGARLLASSLLGGKVSLADRMESLLRRGSGFSARPSFAKLGISAFMLAVLLAAGGLVPAWVAVAQTKMVWPTTFEVASIRAAKPGGGHENFLLTPDGRYRGTDQSAWDLILYAYAIRPQQVVGLPSWAKSRLYDINAEAPPDFAKDYEMIFRLPLNQRKGELNGYWRSWLRMLRTLLADRFKLKVHRATKQLPVYELVVAKGEAKMKPFNAADFPEARGRYSPGSQWYSDDRSKGTRQMNAFGISALSLANDLGGQIGQTVIDKTGLTGKYDFRLTWTPAPGSESGADFGLTSGHNESERNPADVEFSKHWVSIFTAVQQQLGLKLVRTEGPVQVLVVDHIEPPTPN